MISQDVQCIQEIGNEFSACLQVVHDYYAEMSPEFNYSLIVRTFQTNF
jgi:hypothetical protein